MPAVSPSQGERCRVMPVPLLKVSVAGNVVVATHGLLMTFSLPAYWTLACSPEKVLEQLAPLAELYDVTVPVVGVVEPARVYEQVNTNGSLLLRLASDEVCSVRILNCPSPNGRP